MKTEQTNRFKDAPWFSESGASCVIGGSGGIGSWLTVLLTRAGFNPVVYDFDTVEEHNIGGQLFGIAHTGMPKVNSIKEVTKMFTDTDINVFNEEYVEGSMTDYYVFSAFDNMKARKVMFENWKNHIVEPYNPDEDPLPVFIDGRLTMEQLQIFCVTPSAIENYEKHLFDDAEVEDAPCTLKQTSHSAAMIASHMVGFFTNHLTNVFADEQEREVPFMWEYFIPIDYIKSE